MEEDEYAIVSKKEFLTLKRELDKLKQNPLEGSDQGETLQASIDNLNRSLNTMLEVFKQAADEMKLEEHDTELVSKQMGPLNDKLDTLIDQNQKIAKGIVAIADMVKEKLEEIQSAQKPALKPLPPLPKPHEESHAPSSPGGLPPPGSPLGAPSSPGGLPPPGSPPGAPSSPGGLPPPGVPPMPDMPSVGGSSDMPPPGAPPHAPAAPPSEAPKGKDILGGLMK